MNSNNNINATYSIAKFFMTSSNLAKFSTTRSVARGLSATAEILANTELYTAVCRASVRATVLNETGVAFLLPADARPVNHS